MESLTPQGTLPSRMAIGTDPDTQTAQCYSCGHQWSTRDRYHYWPMGLRWKPREPAPMDTVCWFTWHGYQIPRVAPGLGPREFNWVFHLGRLLVHFGPRRVWPSTCRN